MSLAVGSRLNRVRFLAAVFVSLLFVPAHAAEARKSFDVATGTAGETLKAFARQAGREIVFSAETIGAAQTKAVKGNFLPKEALDQMLADTGLIATQDAQTGAFAVRKEATVPNAPRAAQKSSSRPDEAADKAEQTLQMETFQVTAIGQRYVNQDALQSKRVNTVIYDSISQDDIGKLPDVNIADSFRRIPGVSAQNDEDEGRFVIARGMQPALSFVALEGVAIATHDAFGGGGRNVNLETIPASAVKRLEVYKTFLPFMDGGSVGSYLNLVTRSASDKPGTFLTTGLQGGYFTQRAVPARSHPISTRAQLNFGHTFGQDDRFGIMVSIEDFRKSRDEEKVIQDTYNYFDSAGVSTGTPFVGNGYAAPGQFRQYSYNNDLVRTGLTAKLEFNPSQAFRSYVSVYRFRQVDDEDRFGHQLISLAGISNQTASSGTYARASAEVSFTHNDIRRKLDGVHYHAEFTTGRGELTFDAAFSGTLYSNSTPFIGFRPTAASTQLGINYNSNSLVQTYQFTSPTGVAFFGNPANYVLNNYNYRELRTYDYATNVKLAYAYNAKGADGPLGFATGLNFKRMDRQVNNNQWNYSNPTFSLSSASRPLAYTPPARSEPFLFLDFNAWNGAFQNGSGPGFTLLQPASYEASVAPDFTYLEDITAGYLMGTYQARRLRLAGGLRYESVDATAATYNRLIAPTPDQFIPIKISAGYNSLLPSATGSFEITDRFWIRGGVSQSVGRPDPADIATLQTVSADGLTVTRGNPNLKPREARNYDLSFEYYFPKASGVFSVALFRKEISKDIFNLVSQETVNGILATVTQPTNATNSRIQGIEIGLMRNRLPLLPAWLDGLGFTGNITFFDTTFNYVNAQGTRFTRDTLPLQSKMSANAALAYEWRGKGEIRVAYDYKDRYLTVLNANSPWLNEGWRAYGQWDVTARYQISRNLHLDASVRNLGNAHRVHVRGEKLQLLHEDVDFGSSVWCGVTYRL